MEINYPYIQLSKHPDYAGFYVVSETGEPLKINSITLIGAVKDALKLGYDINLKQWVDEKGSISPILFTVDKDKYERK
jgi:hypothetical protein